jgi:hypothetical protein
MYSLAAMQDHHSERSVPPSAVRLRDARPADVATLFAFECDPAWGAMAMVKPRSREAFEAVWEKILQNRAAGVVVRGVVQKVIGGVKVRITSPAKTVADCLKYRNKLGRDVAVAALRDYKRSRRSMDELFQAARVCRVEQTLRTYLEVMG